ncbi:MAG: FtsX-like permease family protein [Bernardetiaceae bacterium]|nr:FtsX-like permease family protein [Bernardetiaceae bacterium]
MHLFSYAISSLRRHQSKYIALTLIYAIVVGFYASVVFFTTALREETQSVLQDLPELWVQQLAGGRLTPISKGVVNELAQIRGVAEVHPRIWGYYFDETTGAVMTLMGSDRALSEWAFLTTDFQEKLQRGKAVCGTGYLEVRGLEIGDFISLNNPEGVAESFEIVSSFEAASDLLTRDLIVVDHASAQRLLGLKPNEATDIALSVYNESEVPNIARKITAKFPNLRLVALQQLKATYQTLFSWRGGIFVYGAMVSVLAFLLLVWERASGQSGTEKKEVGILKGLGWQVSDVLLLKLFEHATVSIIATLLGMLMAYFHVFILNAPLLKPFLIGWSELYPSFSLSLQIQTGDVLVIFALSVVPYLSATLIPAWQISITDPAEAMQGGK